MTGYARGVGSTAGEWADIYWEAKFLIIGMIVLDSTLSTKFSDNEWNCRFDASGNVLEHYSDGDLVNIDTKVTREPAAPQTIFVWGPNIPLAFMSGRIEDAVIDNKLAITHPQLLEEPNATVNKTSTTATVDVSH
jgi:hypothetical protein